MVYSHEMIPFLIGLVVIVVLAVYSFNRSHMHMATTFGWLMVCVGFWVGTYTLDIANTDYHVKLFWLKLKYIGATSSSVFWLILAMVFTNNEKWLNKAFYTIMGAWSAIIVILAFTNDWHYLFWSSYEADINRIESVTIHGPLFPLYALVGAGVVPVSIAIYASHLVKVQRFYRNRALMFVIAGCLPVFGNIAHAFGYTLVPNVDQVPLMLVIGCCIYAVAIFRYQALDVLKVAQNLVIDSVKAGVVVVDHKRMILGFNPYAADILEHARVNMAIDDVIPESTNLDLKDDQEFEIETKKGKPQCFLVKVSEIENPKVGKLGHALILLDITARKNAERALNESMETRSRFFANMSHELRTPLHGISGLLELIKTDSENNKQLDYVEKAETSANLLLSLINDVLDLSRIDAGRIEYEQIGFNLADVIKNISSMLSPQAQEKGLSFSIIQDHVSTNSMPFAVQGDPLRLTQVLNNLVSNAIKFTATGKVELLISTIASTENTITLEFKVTDTGPGISIERQPSLFEAFTQGDSSTTRNFGGSGLGLAISQQLVRGMGGELIVESELDKGSAFSFSIELPIFFEIRSQKQTTNSTPSNLNGSSVLVVDDAAVNRQVAEAFLEQVGVSVTLASNGYEAINLLTEKTFDAVLMDVHMPNMDGYLATKNLRNELKLHELPVIAMTASAFEEDRRRAMDAGMNDFIAKPFRSHDLYAILSRWLTSSDQLSTDSSLTSPLSALSQSKRSQLFLALHDEAVQKLSQLNSDPEEWGEYIHFVKGSAGFLGVTELLTLAKKAEHGTPKDLSELQAQFEIALAALKLRAQSPYDDIKSTHEDSIPS